MKPSKITVAVNGKPPVIAKNLQLEVTYMPGFKLAVHVTDTGVMFIETRSNSSGVGTETIEFTPWEEL